MNLHSFADELCRLHGGRSALAKIAGVPKPTGNLFARMGSIGAASGLGAHGLQYAKSLMTGNPMDEPQEGPMSSVVKGGLGGLTIAGLLSLIGKAAKKR
jgi:hypothetical protein